MKKEITALELRNIISELDFLIDSKVDKIYHPEKKELVINFYVSGKGKIILRLVVPNFLYLTDYKQEYPEKPSNFCVFLRKKLDNTRLKEINQLGFERIVEFIFESKQERFRLIFELFSKGNIVLCKDDFKILRPIEVQIWSKRSVKPGQIYDYPKREFNIIGLKKSELKEIINKSKKNVVKTLAMDLGLGGLYAEEICMLAKIEKDKKELEAKELDTLFKAITKLAKSKNKPTIVYDKEKVIDVTPFDLKSYDKFEKKPAKSYNEALDSVLTKRLVKTQTDQKMSKHQKKIEKLNKIIEKQGMRVKKLESDIKKSNKSAELIYNNYKLIENVFEELNKAMKKYSIKEIKEKLKNHKIVKEINAKEKSIVVELK